MKITLIIVLLFLTFTCQAQQVYSNRNLSQSTLENLDLYLIEAQKLKKVGSTTSITGTAIAATGFLILGVAGQSNFRLGFPMLLAGIGTTAIGIPILICGSTRVKKVNNAINALSSVAWIELAPCSHYNPIIPTINPGLKLTVRF